LPTSTTKGLPAISVSYFLKASKNISFYLSVKFLFPQAADLGLAINPIIGNPIARFTAKTGETAA
jgi:hypothetical protein